MLQEGSAEKEFGDSDGSEEDRVDERDDTVAVNSSGALPRGEKFTAKRLTELSAHYDITFPQTAAVYSREMKAHGTFEVREERKLTNEKQSSAALAPRWILDFEAAF